MQVKELAQEGRVLKAVIEVESLIAHPLLIVRGITQGNIERFFLRSLGLRVGSLPFKAHPDAVEDLTIHGHRGRKIGVGGEDDH